MSSSPQDRQLDEQLKAVPPSADLAERLRAIAAWDDAAIDRELADVSLPAGLLENCRLIPDNEELDTFVRDVAVPEALPTQLRPIAAGGRIGFVLRFLPAAIAASLLALLFAGNWARQRGWLEPMWPGGPTTEVVTGRHGTSPSDPDDFPGPEEYPPIEDRSGAVARTNDAAVPRDFPNDLPNDQPGSVLAESLAQHLAGLHLLDSMRQIHLSPLAAPRGRDESSPTLESAMAPKPRGLEPPLVRGFDRKFLFQHRVQPVVVPQADPRLAVCPVPLWTRTESFDLLLRRLAERRLPDASEIRVEDFLAALDDPFTAVATGEVGLRSSAGVSPFGENGARLVQIATVAGPSPTRPAAGTHLVVAVDVSQGSSVGGRLDLVRRALLRQIDRLDPRDRLSLVLFSDRTNSTVVGASQDQRAELLSVVEAMRPQGGADLLSGVQRALSVALETPTPAGMVRRVALLTDSHAQLPDEIRQTVCHVLGQLSATGTRLHLVDLSDDHDLDPGLEQLAIAGQGRYLRGSTVGQISAALGEFLYAGPSVAATQAKFRMTFNPKAVAGYRLLGHEASLAGGLEGEALSATLHYDEAATALFEVWLKPDGEERIAEAELQFVDSEGNPHVVRQPISRTQTSATWAESPLSLQAAALMAQTAEVLRNSTFVPARSRRDLRGVLELAHEANPKLAEKPWFRRFLGVVNQAQVIRQRTSG